MHQDQAEYDGRLHSAVQESLRTFEVEQADRVESEANADQRFQAELAKAMLESERVLEMAESVPKRKKRRRRSKGSTGSVRQPTSFRGSRLRLACSGVLMFLLSPPLGWLCGTGFYACSSPVLGWFATWAWAAAAAAVEAAAAAA